MRAVIQRVSGARVFVAPEYVAEIGVGLLVYLGVARGDGVTDASYVVAKTARLRIFEDDAGKMNRSALDQNHAVLLVSQFTLHGDVRRGLRPSFAAAEDPALADDLYCRVLDGFRSLGLAVAAGRFGAHMEVTSTNSGPVTILIDSRKLF